jgi:hypothetical protein
MDMESVESSDSAVTSEPPPGQLQAGRFARHPITHMPKSGRARLSHLRGLAVDTREQAPSADRRVRVRLN